jgi:nucleoside 2-deoxyribosyltransferase
MISWRDSATTAAILLKGGFPPRYVQAMNCAKCLICDAPAMSSENPRNRVLSVECARCGTYRADHYAVLALKQAEWSAEQIGTASGYLLRNAGLFLNEEVVERLAVTQPPSVAVKAGRLLLELGRLYSQPGVSIGWNDWNVLPGLKIATAISADKVNENLCTNSQIRKLRWLGVASAASAEELQWLVNECLRGGGFLSKGRVDGDVVISPSGWREIGRLQQVNVASGMGFVAMSFRDEFTPLYAHGIEPGIQAAGYNAIRVDRKEHNNRIDDEIIASIKQSRFLVADFTLNRGGIYFEAGFAMGLGLPVIWLAREDQLAEVHFDNRQYNFITWCEGTWDELCDRLRFRIEATIGHGPFIRPVP